MLYYLLKFLLLPIFKLFWIGEVEGLENIPKKEKGGFIFASNHQSFFDFLVLVGVSPRRIYFLTGEVFFEKWPWWSWLVNLTGQIKIVRYGDEKERKESAIKAKKRAIELLLQGKVIGIYPEGTRSRTGKLQKARGVGVAYLALAAKVPIVPVGMIGTYQIMSPYDHIPKIKKCKIRIGEPLNFSKYYSQENDRKVLKKINKEVMTQIGELIGKI
jgi:1-acyl-sn-glycerol-3-phosphate acyltransferase